MDLKTSNATAQTAVHVAVVNDNAQIIHTLAEMGADCTVNNGEMHAPLLVAVWGKHHQAVKVGEGLFKDSLSAYTRHTYIHTVYT